VRILLRGNTKINYIFLLLADISWHYISIINATKYFNDFRNLFHARHKSVLQRVDFVQMLCG